MSKTLSKSVRCEVCGATIPAGQPVEVRYDYDWDNPDEDLQGSVAVPFYRHADQAECRGWREARRVQAEIEIRHEQDRHNKATQ